MLVSHLSPQEGLRAVVCEADGHEEGEEVVDEARDTIGNGVTCYLGEHHGRRSHAGYKRKVEMVRGLSWAPFRRTMEEPWNRRECGG